ncbi:UNVERIFIED_CONTAM: Golgin candidate 6 [Sesamum calycinum]|uniref:Golgin candidate 6 n=1 Tax=Sesamum calycinum TaxID=2727403 RepID=A0AAW2LYI6_9LAMI
MDFVSKYQGVVGRVFRNDNSSSSEDSYVERLLDRISNGVLAEDRRSAMVELQSVVAESNAAQLAFGAMGFPVLLSVLKEERDDVEMVRGALETLVSALSPIEHAKASKNEVQPALMNSDLLSREVENISLLLSLLVRLLYANCSRIVKSRLQEAILTIPRGITRLMDMLMDREVIRNEALLLLTYLTREAEEIQKIVVFEGAFEKIFSIIKEEGGSEGAKEVYSSSVHLLLCIVIIRIMLSFTDCLELLNNLLRNNASNQVLLRETMGFDPLISILKLRGSTYKFTQQKTINLLSVLDTINLLLHGGQQTDPGKDTNGVANKTVLVQKKVLDHLLVLGVESQWAPVAVRCMALQCIGDLVVGHPKNCDAFASKVIGEEPHVEPALNSILRIILRTPSVQEFVAADYVFKSYCEKNPDGQRMLASTLTPQPHSMVNAPFEDDVNMSFGSMLLHGLILSESDGDLEACCRAASVLSHVLKDNIQCKEKVLQIELETPRPSLGAPEPLMHRMVKYLALASSMVKDGKAGTSGPMYIQPIILKLLVIWLFDCPIAVQCFLDSRPHLTYFLELISDQTATKSLLFTSAKPALARKPLTRSTAASMSEIEDVDENETTDQKNEDHPVLAMVLDSQFVFFVKELEANIREQIVEIYSRPKTQVAVVPAELEQNSGESDKEYIKRLKRFVEKQCLEIQDLLSRNATLAENAAKTGASGSSQLEHRGSAGSERVLVETLRRDLHETSQRLEALKAEKARIEVEASTHQNLASKLESDLKSLSDAYNSLEQANFQLEHEVKALKSGGALPIPDIEEIKAEAREEAQKESEAELSDLLVCLGQEQSKVEKLSARLVELGEDVDKLLEGIGDDMGVPDDDEDEAE